MIAKRVVALVVMAMISTVSPAVYQKGLEPRLGALDSEIEINSFTYDAARSGKDVLCYKAWITVRNPNPYEVILSQLDLDMFYSTAYRRGYDGKELERFKKIGSFNTTQEYTIPASKGVNVPESEYGAIASFDEFSHKIYEDPLWGEVSRSSGQWTDVPVFAYVYLSTQYEGNATEEAIAQLLDTKRIAVDLQGDLIIGPLKMPVSLPNVELNLDIWGEIFTLIDVVGGYQRTVGTGIATNDVYYIQAIIQNPSGNPFIMKDYRFDLYAGGATPIALGIDSRYLDFTDVPTTPIFDPDIYQTLPGNGYSTRVPLRDIAWGTYDNTTQLWQSPVSTTPAVEFSTSELEKTIIFPLNFSTVIPDPGQITAKNNVAKFMDALLKNATIEGFQLKGVATIALGTTQETGTINGIEVNFGSVADWQNDPNRFKPVTPRISLTETLFFQKSKENPQNIEDRMQLGSFQVTKIDVNKNTKQITLNATSSVNFTNPYRIEMNFTEFGSAIDHDDGVTDINAADRFSEGTESRIMRIWRGYRTMTNPTAEPTANTTTITTNVTIGYNTEDFDTDSGLGQIYKDIGFWQNGSLQTFNLTNPFHVLGPNGVKLEDQNGEAPNWMQLVDYLISNQVDPLMLLHEVNTTGETYTGVDAFIPTACSTFGTVTHTVDINGVIHEPEDFPSTNSHIGGIPNYLKPYHTPTQFSQAFNMMSWNDYWDNEGLIIDSQDGNGYKKNDRLVNQWCFAAGKTDIAYGPPPVDTFNVNSNNLNWIPDWGNFMGTIWQKTSAINATGQITGPTYTSNMNRFYPSDIKWRFDAASTMYGGQFGYWYDFASLEKGYYLAMKHPDWVSIRQNFTLPAWLNSTDISNIKATLSMSYRYPYGASEDSDVVVLGISNQSLAQAPNGQPTFTYVDQLPGQEHSGLAFADYLWKSPYPGTPDWHSASFDVTSMIQSQLDLMPAVNASKIEVLFGKTAGGGAGNLIYLDDLMLRIEYVNQTKLSTISPYELFSYIEENDQEAGNMWNMMDQLNFNATKFTAFLEGTLGHGSAPGAGINFIDFMKQSGAKPETMPELLQGNFMDLGGSEPVNFLQMLNQTKYRAARPQYLAPPYIQTAPSAPYGPRDNNLANWVVEDPLKASQVFAQALMSMLYTTSTGGFIGGDIAGEELWNMLENLEVYLPWVCMYLVQHGWSKDDIFDLLEALGIGMETRQPLDHVYYTNKATGSLRVKSYMEVWVRLHITVLGIGFEIGPFSISSMSSPIVANFKLGMGETMLDPVTDLFFLLGAPGTTQDVDGSGTIDSDEYNAIPLQVAGAVLPDPVSAYQFSSDRKLNPVSLVDWIELTPNSKIGIKEYTLGIWINGKSTVSNYAPPSVPAELTPYTAPSQGLTTAGAQQLFQNYRQNVKFQGETFLQTGGNPISLFQFLDNAFFTEKNGVNYSSYTLMNHYNSKAIDFIDILTDFNRTAKSGAGAFDSLGNGICDEWTAPSARNWEGGSSHYDTALTGFGSSYRDNRLFKGRTLSSYPALVQPYVQARTNTIIWTDSPSLARVSGASGLAHRQGDVYLDSYADQDFFEKGAPPVVNLLDMFAWLSMITGKPDPDTLINWLTGQLGNNYYDVIGNGLGSTSNSFGPAQGVKKGLGYDNTWTLFKNITMNGTGMVNWMENVKHLSPFKFFYMMNQTDQKMDPLQLLFYATNQNWILNPDGSIAFVMHKALGTTNAIANANLWNVLNSTWWTQKDPYGADPMFNLNGPTYATFPHLFYQYLRDLEADNGAYNLFVMMEALTVDPVSWINIMQWRYGIRPLELYAVYNTLDYEWAIQNRTGGRSRIRVNCNVSLQVNGLTLNAGINSFNWALEDRELTADFHLRNFLVAANLYRNSYVYYPYNGIP